MGKESKKKLYQYGSEKSYYLLRHSGFFDIARMLKSLKEKLNEFGYKIITDKEHTESLSAAGKETKFVWACKKEVTDYIKFEIEITIITIRQIDVIVDKKKMQRGDFEFRIKAVMIKNYKKTFMDSKMGEIQRHLYEKIIVPLKLEDREDRLLEEARDLISLVKEHLK